MTDGDVGKAINVRVSFTDDRGHQEHTAGPTTSIILTKLVQPSTLSYPLTPVRHPTASDAG